MRRPPEFTPLTIERGCAPTEDQAFVEVMLDAATRAQNGVTIAPDALVPAPERGALIDLCRLLATRESFFKVKYVHLPLLQGSRRIPGIRLTPHGTTIEIDGPGGREARPYVLVLTTWAPRYAHDLDGDLVVDGHTARLLETLRGSAFRLIFHGLLRLVEFWASQVAQGDDYSWGSLDGADEGRDEQWHPDEMLKRVRAMRRQARTIVCVAEVLYA